MLNTIGKKVVVVGIAFAFIFGAFLPAVNSQLQNNVKININKQVKILNPQINEPRENLDPYPLDFSDPWWNNNWRYRKNITIDHTKVDTSLSNFPVLISIVSDDNLSNSNQCQIDGDDIAFADLLGNQLNHEIEFFDNDAGDLIVWVNVTSISDSSDTVIYMYYGNPSSTNQENVEGTWDSDFRLVHHLSGSGYTDLDDSTSFNNDVSAEYGSPLYQQSGPIGECVYLDSASNEYLDIPDDNSLSFGDGTTDGGITICAWVNMDTDLTAQRFVSKADATTDGEYLLSTTGGDKLGFFTIDENPGVIVGRYYNTNPILDTWYYVVGTYNGGGDIDVDASYDLWIDGIELDDATTDTGAYTAMENTNKNLHFGKYGTSYLNGWIDEIRISDIVRSDGWINTSFINQNDPSAFLSLGSEEIYEQPIISDPDPAHGSTGVLLSLENLTFTILDYQGDTMTYYVETTPNIGSDSASVGNGTYNVSISGLSYSTFYTWYVNVTDGTNWARETYSFTTINDPSSWWNTSFNYRKLITINSSQIDASLTNFPVLIHTNSDSDLNTHAQSDGDDIFFTDYYNITKYNHEIEKYDTGTLYAWVNITNLDDEADTLIWMYYGDSICNSQEDVEGTWDSDFRLVHHLSGSGYTDFDDSTNFNNDVSAEYGSPQYQQSGQIGDCVYLDSASSEYLEVSDSDSLSFGDGSTDESMTICAWVNMDTSLANQRFVCKADSSSVGEYLLTTTGTDKFADYTIDDSANVIIGRRSDSFTSSLDTWYYLVGTYNGGGDTDVDASFDLWINGAELDDATVDNGNYVSMENTNLNLHFGKYGTSYLDGWIDEIRLSSIVRTDGWIKTSYNNMNNKTTFIDVGIEEAQPEPGNTAPTQSGESPATGSIGIIPTPNVYVIVSDVDGDTLNVTWWSNSSGAWLQFGVANTGVISGTNVSQIFSNASEYNHMYWWSANVSDGEGGWINVTYHFTTILPPNNVPTQSGESPTSGSLGVLSSPFVYVIVSDVDGDTLNVTWWSNSSGAWLQFGVANTGVISGTNVSQIFSNASEYNHMYWWSANVSDGEGGWINVTYHFTTILPPNNVPTQSGESPTSGSLGVLSSPFVYVIVSDVDGDTLNVTWWSNSSGAWLQFGVANTGVISGTNVSQIFSNASEYNHMYWWSANVSDGEGGWSNNTYHFTTSYPPADWWDDGWSYRKGIVINSSMVASNLVNFPILISEIDSDLGNNAQVDGNDIVFANYNGDKLNHEIEYYNSGNGELIAWVNVTSLSSTTDTILYMYYGNDFCENQQNITGVWNSDYVIVQHLNETSGAHFDSTSYGNNGTISGGVNQNTAGVIDGADSFDGTDGYVNIADVDSLSFGDGSTDDPFTVGAWIYMDSSINTQRFICKADSLNDGEYILSTTGGNVFTFSLVDQSGGGIVGRTYSATPSSGQWYYLVGTYDGSGSTTGIDIYLDGIVVDDGDLTSGTYTAMENSGKPLYLGKYSSDYLDGLVDEARISKGVKSPDWINTSFLNQNDPSSFYSFDYEETNEVNHVLLSSPMDETLSDWTIDFSFIPIFYDSIQKAELYVNESGVWDVVETILTVTSNTTNTISHTVSHTYPYPEEGTYSWNVKVWNDTTGVFASSNRSFTIDIEPRWKDNGSNTTTPFVGEPVSLYAQGYDSIGLDSAWLATDESGEWVNYTDTKIVGSGNGSIEFSAPSCTTQRGILYKGIMYDTECGSLYIRNWSTMNVLDTHALGGYTNTAPCLDLTNEEIVYASCSSNGRVIGYNTTSKSEIWSRTFVINETGPRDVDARCLYLDDGYLFVLLCNFTIYKLNKTNGNIAGFFNLDYGDVGAKGTRMYSVDADENRIYGVGYSKFHCINSTTMIEIWNATVPDGSGSEGNSVPMVVKDDGLYHIYFGTVLDIWDGTDNTGYVHCFDYNGTEIWNKSIDGAVHSHMAYNPLTEYVYANDFFDYDGAMANHIYALNRSTGEEIWNVSGPRNDHFVRRVEFVGNVGLFHTDNHYAHGGGDYLYLFNADDGTFFGEIPYSGESLCNIIISDGKAVIGGVNGLIMFDLGIGDYVEYKYLYGNYRTGYTDANALIAYGSSFTNEPLFYGSPIDLGGASDTWVWSNFTWQNDSVHAGTTVHWRIYYNDSYGNVNATDINSFTIQERSEPLIFDPDPINNTINVPVTLSFLNVTIEDPQGESFNWTVETSPDIGNEFGNNDFNGTKSCDISGLNYNTTYTWYVNATDIGGNWTRKSYTFSTELEHGVWWDYGWLYRKELIINSSLVASDLENFPILFSKIDSDLAIYAQVDCDDIVFTDTYGEKLSHEIEYYNSSNGELVAWINITSLNSAVDTVIYMYYGNDTCASQEDVIGVWDSDFVFVQHLNETSGTHFDSTNYNNDGTIMGDTNQNAIGKVDGTDSFDGSGDYVNVADADSLSFGDGSSDDPFSIGAWIYMDSTNSKQRFVGKADDRTDGEYLLTTSGPGNLALFLYDQSSGDFIGRTYSALPALDQWYYLVGTYDGSSSTGGIKLYLDGERVDDADSIMGSYVAMENSEKPLYFGKYASDYLDGLVDEVRISKGVKSNGWINTSFNTMNFPSSFLSTGNQETWDIKEQYKITLADNWNIISLPFNESVDKTDFIVNYNGTNYSWANAVADNIVLNFIYGWNRTNQNYELKNILEPGNGYWAYSYHDDVDLVFYSNMVGDNNITKLLQQWCIAGLPYNTSLAKEDIIVHYNITDYTWNEATTDNNEEGEPLILQFIYGWDRINQTFFLSDELVPDFGYWMYAYYSCILKKE